MSFMVPLRAALVAALLAAAAPAADRYVDAVNGSDANGGTSSADAWRTLTHATAQLAGAGVPNTLHVAPGTYDAALGEAFPILLPDNLTVRGAPGAVVDGAGAPVLFRWGATSPAPDRTLRLEGLVVRDGGLGFEVFPGNGLSGHASVVDCRFEQFTEAGLWHRAETLVGDVTVRLTLDRVTVRECEYGVRAWAMADEWFGDRAYFELDCRDSLFADNVRGIIGSVDLNGANHGGLVTARNTRFERHGQTAIHLSLVGASLWRCVIADGDSGLGFLESTSQVSECTIVGNAVGVSSTATWGSVVGLQDSVVWGNADDLAGTAMTLGHCDVGDGDFAGTNGNFSADPRFWAPELGDYRLAPGSPCIDAGDPAGPLDPDGSIGDVGAFVHDPLYVPAPLAYCEGGLNSLGQRAVLGWSGSVSLAANALVLDTSGCPPGNTTLYLYGAGVAETPLGGGTLCVGAGGVGLFRLPPPQPADAAGHAVRVLDFGAPPMGGGPGQVLPGSRWNVQLWYRDGASVNLSNALALWFLP